MVRKTTKDTNERERRESWNPLLKSYHDSEKVNLLSFAAETLYTRLIAQADDFGNYDADPFLLLTGLFRRSIKSRQMEEALTERMRDEIVAAGLMCLYRTDDTHLYLHVNDCRRKLRADVTPDKRFPDYSPEMVVAGTPDVSRAETGRIRNEDVPDTVRARAEHGPLDPDPDQTQTITHTQTQTGREAAPADDRDDQREDRTKTANPSPMANETQAITLWNRSVPKDQQCPPDGTPEIDRAYSGLVNACPPIGSGEITGAIENYRKALAVPNTMAHPHTLGKFLRREIIRNYLPGAFHVANYDRSRYHKEGDAAGEQHECQKHRTLDCPHPGIHKHVDSVGADYFLCNMHEQERRQLLAAQGKT